MTLIKTIIRSTSTWVLLWLVWMAVIFSFSSLPGSATYYEPPLRLVLERKGAHVIEYAVLFLLSIQVFSLLFHKESLKRILVIAFSWSLTYAVLDELHQFFTPFRGAYVRDVFIDLGGILLALLFVGCVYYWKTKKTLR